MALRSDPAPRHQELQKVPRSRPRVVAWTQTLEETPTTAAPHGDAARLLPVLRLAPLRPAAQLDPPRRPATLGARPATPRSTTADQLVYLSNQPWFELPSARTLHPTV